MSEFGDRTSAAYAPKGKALDLGRGVVGGAPDPSAVVQLSAAMCNRHGLITGATGTGKTKTLELMAEKLSTMGVSVFAADMKGAGSFGPRRPTSDAVRPVGWKFDMPQRPGAPKQEEDGAISGYLKSREGRTMMNRVVRGVFDMLKK